MLTVGNSNFYLYLHVRLASTCSSLVNQENNKAKHWGCFVASWLGVVLVVFIILLHKVIMPHPTKKQRLEGQVASSDSDFVASFDDVVDVLPNILGFLPPKELCVLVCAKTAEMLQGGQSFHPLSFFLSIATKNITP